MRLADEVTLLAPVLAETGTPLYLVGHSYGGAIAVKNEHIVRFLNALR
jgi:alpha-beta hydrolase superfamily lysophospholipase